MSQEKTVYDVLHEFFKGSWNTDSKEYWAKMTKDHVKAIATQIEIFMSQNYVNPALIKEAAGAMVLLNNELQQCLRVAVQHAHDIYVGCGFEKGADSEQAEKNWMHDITSDPGWIQVFAMLDALDLNDPKQKEKYDAEFKNNGHRSRK